MKGYCPMCAYDHEAKCEIDETTVTWYTHKILREFLKEEFGMPVKKEYRDKQTYEIYGKNLILRVMPKYFTKKELEGEE